MDFLNGVLPTDQSSELLPALFSLLLKSTIVLVTAALLNSLLRSASARVRHSLWCAALSSLLVLPLFTGGLQLLSVPILPSGLFANERTAQQTSQEAGEALSGQTPVAFPSGAGTQAGQNSQSDQSRIDEQGSRFSFSWSSIILLVWLTGALLVFSRFLVGIFTVRRLVRSATELTGAAWSEMLSELSQQIQLRHRVRLLLSDESVMPMACVGVSATVVLPNEANRWPTNRRRVVVLHELIHIKRRDLLIQTLSQIVFALYWFNPLVWWSVRKLRIEQEWACDERVVASGIEASEYAAHLLDIARKFHVDGWSVQATTAMARSSQLQERLCAILRPIHERYRSGRVIAVSVVLLSVVFISTAAARFVVAKGHNGTNVSSAMDDVIQVEQNEPELPAGRKAFVTDVPNAPVSQPDYALHQTPSPTPVNNSANQPADAPATSQDSGSRTEEQIFNGFSDEERDRLINNGIGPAYIKEMFDAGYRQLTAAQLIALFSNGVHADDVAGLRSVGYSSLSTADLLALKTNGITPEVVRSFQAVRYANFRAMNYIAFRSNGVTPSYLKSLSAVGYTGLTPKQIVDMYVAGVTSDFIRDALSRGNANLSPEDLIQLRRRGRH